MNKLISALFLLCLLTVSYAGITPEQTVMLETAAKQITTLSGKNFTVKMVSPELGKLLADQVAAKSAQLGMPIQIGIKHFLLTSKNGQQSCKVTLSDDTPMKDALEPQANSMLASSGIGKMLSEASFASLNQAAELLLASKDSFSLMKESPKSYDFSADQDLGTFAGIPVSSVKIRISKANQSLSGFILDMQDLSRLRGTLQMQKSPDGSLFYPVRLKLESSLKKAIQGISLPSIINAVFSEYQFQ